MKYQKRWVNILLQNDMVVILIQAFVSSNNYLPDLGRLRVYYPIRMKLIPQKQVFEFWGISVSFNVGYVLPRFSKVGSPELIFWLKMGSPEQIFAQIYGLGAEI